MFGVPPTKEEKLISGACQPLPKAAEGLEGVLLVTGLSQCKENYQASWLCELPWRCKKPYRLDCSKTDLAKLAQAVSRNCFNLIILAHPAPDEAWTQHEPLNRALKTAVQQKGAYLLLWAAEAPTQLYKLFGKPWTLGSFTRTTCFRTPQAEELLPSVPAAITARAVHLANVPSHERWWASTEASTNENDLKWVHNDPEKDMTSIAAGVSGRGCIVSIGDQEGKEGALKVAHILAATLAPPFL